MSQTLSDASKLGSRSTSFFCLGVLVVAGVATLGVSSRAWAFTNPTDYGTYPDGSPASVGFGAGRYFTGSPADGYSCEVCHSNPRNYSFPLTHKGLPLDGYVPGKQYKIEISWPEATAAYMTAKTQGLNPVATLVAEFIAEDGGPAGTLSFSNAAETNPLAFSRLYCETLSTLPPEEQADAYGMNLYVQDTASRPIELTLNPTSKTARAFNGSCKVEHGKDEDGREYERRCIVALKPCGAQGMKFTWTAPDEWRGPIWFSAGFVTTYDRSAEPNDNDFVTTLSIPLTPGYQGGEHVTVLQSGCSVGHGPRAQGPGAIGFAIGMLSLLGVLRVRSRQRRTLSAAALLIALACVGCSEGTALVTNAPDPVGSYESVRCLQACDPPIECRKSAWPDAGTPESAAEARKRSQMGESAPAAQPPAAAGAGAAGSAAGVASLGTVTAQFTTAQPPGFVSDWVNSCPIDMPGCSPHYVVAWIENEAGEYVRSLLGSQGQFIGLSLVRYIRMGSDCQDPKEKVFIDAMASATIYAHQPHSVMWDGLYGSGYKAAPAGVYRLRIEVAIDESHHYDVADIPFSFGDAAPTTMMFPPEPAHTGVTLTYTPTPP